MKNTGEEIILLPYNDDITDNGKEERGKAKESEGETHDGTGDPTANTDQVVGNEDEELRKHEVPPPVPHEQPQPIEPEEPRQPEKSNAQLPEPPSHYPQPSPTLSGPEACQVIASGMNTEMQQYATSLASEALTQLVLFFFLIKFNQSN